MIYSSPIIQSNVVSCGVEMGVGSFRDPESFSLVHCAMDPLTDWWNLWIPSQNDIFLMKRKKTTSQDYKRNQFYENAVIKIFLKSVIWCMGFFMRSMARSCGGSNNCCHLDEMLFSKTCSTWNVQWSICDLDRWQSQVLLYSAMVCCLYIHNTEGDAEFELEVNQNNCYFSPFNFWTAWILSADPIRVHRLQSRTLI